MKKLIAFAITIISLFGSALAVGQIDISYSPYTISQPGAYIVVKDLITAQNLNCISIMTGNVSIDLNGHTLYGAGTITGTTGYGIIDITFKAPNVSIINGTVRDFRSDGIYLGFWNGRVEHVNAYGNKGIGIFLYDGGQILNNNVSFNGNNGIQCKLGVVRNNSVNYNGFIGIIASGQSVVSENIVSFNQLGGIQGSDASIIRNNSVFQNYGTGIQTDNCLVENNTLSRNLSNGIVCDNSRILNNLLQYNGSFSGLSGSGGAGVSMFYSNNIIENNTILSNDTGLLIQGSGNYFAGNRFRLNTVSISTVTGNTGGDGTNGFQNIIIPHSQPNYLITQFVGYGIPALHESPQAILRNLSW